MEPPGKPSSTTPATNIQNTQARNHAYRSNRKPDVMKRSYGSGAAQDRALNSRLDSVCTFAISVRPSGEKSMREIVGPKYLRHGI